MKADKLILGQKVFWRWKGEKYAYTEKVVLATNGNMIALGDNEYSRITSWLDIKDIELVIKDMSKESL